MHRVVDGMVDLKRAHGFTADEVEQITGTVSDLNARVLHAHPPADALAAKFSMEFACAIAAIEGAVGLHQVTDEQVARADVRKLMAVCRPRRYRPTVLKSRTSPRTIGWW